MPTIANKSGTPALAWQMDTRPTCCARLCITSTRTECMQNLDLEMTVGHLQLVALALRCGWLLVLNMAEVFGVVRH